MIRLAAHITAHRVVRKRRASTGNQQLSKKKSTILKCRGRHADPHVEKL